ncbi:MAG: hypothetical protein ACOCUP_01380 [bacterium]
MWHYDLHFSHDGELGADFEMLGLIPKKGYSLSEELYKTNFAYGASGNVELNEEGLEGVNITFSGSDSVQIGSDGKWSKHLLSDTVTVTG